MNQFVLLPEAAKGLRKALLIRAVLTGSIILFVVVILPMIYSGHYQLGLGDGPAIIMAAGVMVVVYLSGLTRAKDLLASYKLTITEDSIVRDINKVPTIVIPFKDIQNITHCANGSFVIKGSSLLNAIVVPPKIERAEELAGLLGYIKPLTIESSAFPWQKFQPIFTVLFIGVMLGAFLSDNKYLVLTFSIVFVGVMCSAFIVVHRSKNFDNRTRIAMYVGIIPVIAVLIRLIALWQ